MRETFNRCRKHSISHAKGTICPRCIPDRPKLPPITDDEINDIVKRSVDIAMTRLVEDLAQKIAQRTIERLEEKIRTGE